MDSVRLNLKGWFGGNSLQSDFSTNSKKIRPAYTTGLILLVIALGLFCLPGVAAAAGASLDALYVGNSDADLRIYVQGGYSGDFVITNTVTLLRDDVEIASWSFVPASYQDRNRTFDHHDAGLALGNNYTYIARLNTSWVSASGPESYDYESFEKMITAGEVRGEIHRNIVWGGGDWALHGDIYVAEGASLAINNATVRSILSGTIDVRGSLSVDGAAFSGSYFSIYAGSYLEEPAYQNAAVVVRNSTINAEEFDLHARNDPVFRGNSCNGEYVNMVLWVYSAQEISGNNLPNGDLIVGMPAPVDVTITGNTFGSIHVTGARNITISDNSVKSISVHGEMEEPLNGGAITISSNTLAGEVIVERLGSSKLYIKNNQFDNTAFDICRIVLRDFSENEVPQERLIEDNKGLTYIRLGSETAASYITISKNEIINNNNASYIYGIQIVKGDFNTISGNTITSEVTGVYYKGAGIGLGFEGDPPEADVLDNRILENTITGWDVGIGLGSAMDTIIRGNTLQNRRSNIHLGPYQYYFPPSGPLSGTGYPSGSLICNNRFFQPMLPSGVNVSIYDPRPEYQNNWNTNKTPGTNIVGGPFLGGNYWQDYQGTDAGGDGLGDTPYIIDSNNADQLPLIMPILTMAAAPGNPAGPEVIVGPDLEKRINVLIMQLKVSDQSPDAVEIDSLTFDFDSDRVDPSVIGTAYLLSSDPQNYEVPPSLIGQQSGSAHMTFGDLGEVLTPGAERVYILQYAIEREDPACATYGAKITPERVGANFFASSFDEVKAIGAEVSGSVFNKGSSLTVTIFPEGAGTVTITPENPCYAWGESVTVQVTPNEGYAFDHFEDPFGLFGGGANNPATVTMTWQEMLDLSGIAYLMEIIPLNGKNHGKAKDPVNTATGEFYFDLPLFDLGGPMPLALSLHYGSAVTAKRDVALSFGQEMGPGWVHNFQILRIWKGDTRTRIVYDRGTVLAFELEGGQWKLLNREDTLYELKADSSGWYYFLDPDKKWVYVFDDTKKLSRIEDRNGNTHALRYDDAGYLAGVTDGLGRSLNFTHDENGRLLTVDDDRGRSFSFEYTDGALSSLTDPMVRVTAFEYDRSYRYPLLTRVIEPKGRSLYAQTYDEKGRVIAQTDAYENRSTLSVSEGETLIAGPDGTSVTHTHADPVVRIGHGEPNLLTGVADAQGAVTAMGYDGNNRRTSVTDRMGDRTTVSFHEGAGNVALSTNALDQTIAIGYAEKERAYANPLTQEEVVFTFYDIARVDYPDGSAERFFHDVGGNMTSKVERDGKTWISTYDSRGLALTITNSAGGTITYTYNHDGTLASSRDSDSGPTAYRYDPSRRLNEIVHPDGTSTQMRYDLSGALVSMTDENGNTHTYSYDANQCLIRSTDPLDLEVRFDYDLMDRIRTVTDKLGHVSTFAYDEMGRLITTTAPDGLTNHFRYDPSGRLTGLNRGGTDWQAALDAEGGVTSITTPMGRTTAYLRDKLGEAAAATTPLNRTTTLERDAMGRLTAVTDALSRRAAYGYDSLGQLSRVTLPAVGAAVYTRDDLGLVKEITDLNGSTWRFERSGMGRLLQTTDPLGRVLTHTYDIRGRLFQTTYPDGQTLTRTYDGAGNLTRKRYSGGLDLTFTYDALGSLVAAPGLSLTRDAKGRPSATSIGNIRFEAGFDTGDRLVHADYNDGAFRVTYSYDSITGLLSAVSDNLTNTRIELDYDGDRKLVGIRRSNGIDTELSWDAADRLTGIRDGGILDLHYSLDAAGQIIGAEMRLPLDPAPLLFEEAEESDYDAASQSAASGLEFDTRGRQTRSPLHAFSWDEASRLTGIDAVVLEYNGLGDLTARMEGGGVTRYHYNYAFAHPPVMAESDGLTGRILRYYVWAPDGGLLYMIDAADENRVYFFHFDRTGSTLALTDSSGAVTDAYAYSPYGRLLGHEGENSQPFTYAGKWGVRQEGVAGDLYHMRARYYDAAAARFLSRDSLFPALEDPREINPYQYVAQNPVSYVDPAGMLKIDLQKVITVASYVGKNFLRVGKKVGAKSAKSQGNTTTKFGSYQLKWWESSMLGILSQVPGAEEMANVAYFKKKPSIGTAEYISGGAFRDVAATPFTLTKFGLATLQDLAWWHVGGRDAPGKQANWWYKLFYKSLKWTAEDETAIPYLIGKCKQIEDGWTKIGEWYGHHSVLGSGGRQYGEDIYTVVAGTRKEQPELHSRLLRSGNPLTQAGLFMGEKGYDAAQAVSGLAGSAYRTVGGWMSWAVGD